MGPKKAELQSLILKLLDSREQINIHDVAQAAGLSVKNAAHRRTIQRALKDLLEAKSAQAQGDARARSYSLPKAKTKMVGAAPASEDAFQGIPLTNASKELLSYLAQPDNIRTPVGYNQDFLRSYEPNRSSYLTPTQREALLALGRAENAERPAGTYARNILNRILIDLSWNSSRLEGNTYSLLETQRLVELGENAAGKNATETQMILNHKGAIEFAIDSVSEDQITSHTICSIHALLSENLLGDPGASGRLRRVSVGVGGSTYVPLDNPYVLKETFDILVNKLKQIEDPFEQSFFALVHLSYLQAFEDVNKRTARLVANLPLIRRNFKPLSFTDVHKDAYTRSLLGVYERNDVSIFRDLFVWAYERSAKKYSAIQQSMGEPNLLKLKYRTVIQEIVRTIILQKVEGRQIVHRINTLIEQQELPESDRSQLFQIIETEIVNLHDGNIARFKIRPSEFKDWKQAQGAAPAPT